MNGSLTDSYWKGITTIKYLSKYLYSDVISERNIISGKNGVMTSNYVASETEKNRSRTLRGEGFLKLALQHELPQGFPHVQGLRRISSQQNQKALVSRSDDPAHADQSKRA